MFQKELDNYRTNCIRIHSTQEKMVDLETRNDMLRAEIDRQQALYKVKKSEKRASERGRNKEKEKERKREKLGGEVMSREYVA